MKKAEEMRKIVEKAVEDKRAVRANKSHAYATKVVETKCRKRARKGFNNYQFKMSRWHSPTLVIEHLEAMGFEVKRNSKNGKTILMIKW